MFHPAFRSPDHSEADAERQRRRRAYRASVVPARNSCEEEELRAGAFGFAAKSYYAAALIAFPVFSTTSPIWSSLMMSGGVSSIVSPARRSMIPSSWKECSSTL
jgi:hypothetical protein